MKKSLALILGLCVFLSACAADGQSETIGNSITTPPTSSQTTATTAPAETGGTDVTTGPTEPDSTYSGTASEPSVGNQAHAETRPTEETKPNVTEPGHENETPEQTEPKETEPSVTTPPATSPPETKPAESVPPETQPATIPTEPPVQPNTPPTDPPETNPTEPPSCQHNWTVIHHAEEGHWQAGVVCDCGWTAYGSADSLIALWNAHANSYPVTESLFDHGGYGCVDEWIVDKPAYDEWVCSHCGERKE